MTDNILHFPIRDLTREDLKSLADHELVRAVMQLRNEYRSKLESGELEQTPENLEVLERGERALEDTLRYL